MDKHLHNDIGKQFSNEINKLSQQPREHIWENIDKQLDKTDATNYKDKFTKLRKRSLLLLLLLFGISTFSIIYFNTSKNKNTPQGDMHNYNAAEQKTKEPANNNKPISTDANKQQNSSTNSFAPQPIADNTTAKDTIESKEEQDVFSSQKIAVIKKGRTTVKITNGSIEEEKTTAENDIENLKNNTPQKIADENIFEVPVKPTDAETNIAAIPAASKKDSLSTVINNPSSKANNKKQQNNKSKFTLTAFVAPDYSAYRLENDEKNSYDNKNGIEKRERSDISSSAGILLGYKIGKKVILQSGITYSSSDISIDPTKIYAEKNNAGAIKYRYNTSYGYGYLLPSFSATPAVGDSLFANGANHTLHYIGIPVIIKYKLGNKKITFHPGAGVTFNFLTKATLTTDVQDRFNSETEYISKLEGIKKFSAGLIITPEIQYHLSKKWNISVMPYFKYSLGPVNKGNVVKTYPYTFGVGIGGVFKF
jgi:hypothetical protein